MKSFLDENFLLENKVAERLYHGFAKDLPIIDYHNHLSPKDIASNRQFDNLTTAWLDGDHYKWRAMRANGVGEAYCTGNAAAAQKFEKWAATVPYTLRNPLFHWTHLELQRYFDIDTILKPSTAKDIYKNASEQLGQSENGVQGLLKKMKVEVLCTTDDPTDDLRHHKAIEMSGLGIKVLPTFRPDKILTVAHGPNFTKYINKLGRVTNINIRNLTDLLTALDSRVQYFHDRGCRLSDHGVKHLYATEFTYNQANQIFLFARRGQYISAENALIFKSAMLYYLSEMYHARGWTQQYHVGALRNNSTRNMQALGADSGFDSIGDYEQAKPLGQFLDSLDKYDKLPQTVLYNLNPRDNEVFATMAGNFNNGSTPGKIQYGAAWWFLDQKDGMEKQLNTLSNLGLLGRFVGMVTDSRSFLSLPRHEYFRRILCNLIGKDVVNGELPNDEEWLGEIVSGICYHNAKGYFGF